MDVDKVNIELSKEQAIVFFEFLGRFNDSDNLQRFEDESEQRVLWDIESILEKGLNEPLRADYQDIVKKAREAIRGKEDKNFK